MRKWFATGILVLVIAAYSIQVAILGSYRVAPAYGSPEVVEKDIGFPAKFIMVPEMTIEITIER